MGFIDATPEERIIMILISDQVDTVRLFIHADRALYEAKKIRNAICVF